MNRNYSNRNNSNWNKSNKNKFVKGYFTVEATCIYPFVIAVILLVIYIWFFLYDRCLMEQDFAGILVKGIAHMEIDATSRSEYMENQISSMYRDQYLCWDLGETYTSINGYNIEVSAKGSIYFPFEGLNFWSEDNTWEAERTYGGKRYPRMFIVRTFRKLEGLF